MLSADQIMQLDMKQPVNTMDMSIKIKKPYILIKDRPYFETNLEVDLGELSIKIAERDIIGRFKMAPEKTIRQSQFIIDCKEVSIKYSQD